MTIHELFEFYARKLQDEQAETWNLDEFMVDADQAHRELLRAAGGLQETTVNVDYDTTKTPAYAYYLLPARTLDLKWLKVTISSVRQELREVKSDDLHDDYEADTGTPTDFIREGPRTIRVYPYPTDVAATLTARVKLSPRSLGIIETPELPVDSHLAIAYYAIAEALDRQPEQRDLGSADRWRGKYLAAVADLSPRGLRGGSSRGRVVRPGYC